MMSGNKPGMSENKLEKLENKPDCGGGAIAHVKENEKRKKGRGEYRCYGVRT